MSSRSEVRELAPGDIVNLEVDIIAKYIEQFAAEKKGAINLDFLKEHGYLSE